MCVCQCFAMDSLAGQSSRLVCKCETDVFFIIMMMMMMSLLVFTGQNNCKCSKTACDGG